MKPEQSSTISRWMGRACGFAAMVLAAAASWGVLTFASSTAAQEVTVYKSPSCGCCANWADHLRANGFAVTVREVEDLEPIRAEHGINDELMSCHTAVVEGYAVEGHVPAADVRRLLEERPEAKGLAAPGMPAGSPGMEGVGKEPYDVLLFDENGDTRVFARH